MAELPKCFALINRNDSLRRESTSGGAFTMLASIVIKQGGIVCGAMFTEGVSSVAHRCVESLEGLRPLRKSKYVESDASLAIKSCHEALLAGRKVFFVGTPCQVAALRQVSGNPDSLLTCDLVCHGVPRLELWQSYLSYLEDRVGGKVVKVDFRSKRWGWNLSKTEFVFDNGSIQSYVSANDPYMYAFYRGYSLRSSCLHCTALKQQRPGDLTLGDCWHIGRYCKSMDDNKGTSLVLVNTVKGDDFLRTAIGTSMVNIRPYPYEMAKMNNNALSRPASVDLNVRADFDRKMLTGDNSFWGQIVPHKDSIRNNVVYAAKCILCGLRIPI